LQGSCTLDQQFFDYFWKVKVIPSTKLFVWQAISNEVPTLVNLRLRGVIFNNVTCVMCSDVKKIRTRRYLRIKFATGRKWIL